MLRIQTASGADYPVVCGSDPREMLLGVWQPKWQQVAIIGDSNTLPLFGTTLADALGERCEQVVQLSFSAGEANKTRQTKLALEDKILEAGFDRHCCIVGVGGGIALDVAGYVAATYLRGVAHINVATSLLAQVDAAVGGKTGVNTPHGKNLIGAFHQPRAVLVDLAALNSLPDLELRNGLAEAVKHAVLADERLFETFERWSTSGEKQLPQDMIERCIAIKAEVVARDEKEAAYRQVLNFGHTVAHALETATKHKLLHGEAVAIGMNVEALLAHDLCGFPQQQAQRLKALLDTLGLPTVPPVNFDDAVQPMLHDKKARRGTVYCALPQQIGTMHSADGAWALPVPIDALRAAWERACSA